MKNLEEAIKLLELVSTYSNTLSPYVVDTRLVSTDSFQQDDGITFSAVVSVIHEQAWTSVVFRLKNDVFSYELYNHEPREASFSDPASYTVFQQEVLREFGLFKHS